MLDQTAICVPLIRASNVMMYDEFARLPEPQPLDNATGNALASLHICAGSPEPSHLTKREVPMCCANSNGSRSGPTFCYCLQMQSKVAARKQNN